MNPQFSLELDPRYILIAGAVLGWLLLGLLGAGLLSFTGAFEDDFKPDSPENRFWVMLLFVLMGQLALVFFVVVGIYIAITQPFVWLYKLITR